MIYVFMWRPLSTLKLIRQIKCNRLWVVRPRKYLIQGMIFNYEAFCFVHLICSMFTFWNSFLGTGSAKKVGRIRFQRKIDFSEETNFSEETIKAQVFYNVWPPTKVEVDEKVNKPARPLTSHLNWAKGITYHYRQIWWLLWRLEAQLEGNWTYKMVQVKENVQWIMTVLLMYFFFKIPYNTTTNTY